MSREKTRIVRQRAAQRRSWIMAVTKWERGGCIDCGLEVENGNLVVFDFDHRDPRTKRKPFRDMKGHSEASLRAELAKCDLRCANCHRLRTHREGHSGLHERADWMERLPRF